jgi:hypothetical protein
VFIAATLTFIFTWPTKRRRGVAVSQEKLDDEDSDGAVDGAAEDDDALSKETTSSKR